MGHKGFLHLMIMFLGLSWLVLLSVAVPSSRSLKSMMEEISAQALISQDVVDLGDLIKISEVEEGDVRGRMVMERTDDYAGTGANNHHDPKPPGKV